MPNPIDSIAPDRRDVRSRKGTPPADSPIAWSRGWCIVLAFTLVLGCGGSPDESANPPVLVPDSIRWNPMPGADRYVVRAWAGYRLVFEEPANENSLLITPVMHRALAAFDSVSVEVRGYRAADPDRAIEVDRFRLLPPL